MVEAIYRNLPAKTGKTFDQWVAIARKAKLESRAELIAWLKLKQGLGHVTAIFIAAEAQGKSIAAQYDDEGALIDRMYAGDKAPLRPIYEALIAAAGKLGKDVTLSVCKTYVGVRRSKIFALVKPTTSTRVDLGLALPAIIPAGRLGKAPSSLGSERITHVIRIGSKKEVDAEVTRWLRVAWEASARRTRSKSGSDRDSH